MNQSELTKGKYVFAAISAPDSFYKMVGGTVDHLAKGDRVHLQVVLVVSKWGSIKEGFELHPSRCSINVKCADCHPLEEHEYGVRKGEVYRVNGRMV